MITSIIKKDFKKEFRKMKNLKDKIGLNKCNMAKHKNPDFIKGLKC